MGEDTKRIGEPGAVMIPKRSRALRFGCIIFVALALLLVAINLLMNFLAREQFRREMEEAKKAGFPSSLTEMAPPPVATADNAAVVYQGAWTLVVPPNPQEDAAFSAYTGWKPDRAKEQGALGLGRPYVDRNQAALVRLRQALAKPHCRFDLDYTAGPAMQLPHLAELRRAGKMMRLESRVLLAEGKTGDALRSAADDELLAEALRGEPILISMLVRIAIRGLADESLRRALQEPQSDAEALARVAEVLERTRDDDGYARAMKGERAEGLDIMKMVRSGGVGSFLSSNGIPGAAGWIYGFFGWALYKDMGLYLRIMKKQIELSERPYWEVMKQGSIVDAEVQQAPSWYLLTRTLLPSLDAARRSWEKDRARHDAGRLAVALARYRLAHGAFPDSLDALAPGLLPSIPIDPFTGKPFGYCHAGDSARVYSMGPRGLDNGGGVAGQDDEGTILWPLGDQAPFEGK